MVYTIAGITVDIQTMFDYSARLLQPYICTNSDRPLYSISATTREVEKIHSLNNQIDLPHAEQMMLSLKFNTNALRFGKVSLHASAFKFRGKGYLFSANSQVGKSTQTKLWQQMFPNEVTIINDDKPIIGIEDNVPTVYGTPFSGGSDRDCNTSAPIGAVFFIKRADKCSIRRLNNLEACQNFMENTIYRGSQNFMTALLDVMDKVCSCTQFYELECTPTAESVNCVYKSVIGELL